jgi:hypothetical protein
MAVDAAGNAFFSGSAISKLDPSGHPMLFDQRTDLAGFSPTIAVDSSGNLYTASVLADSLVRVEKHDATGRPVSQFAQGGYADLTFGGFSVGLGLDSVRVDGAGNVYVVASTRPPISARPITVYVIKLDAVGKPVATFGADGSGRITVPSILEVATPAPAMDRAGNVFAAAPTFTGNVAVQKLDVNGQPAADFATTEVGIGCTGFPYTIRRFIAVDGSGNVYLGGACAYGSDTRERPFVVKLDARGSPVASFGEGGIARDFYTAKDAAGAPLPTAVDALVPGSDGSLYVGASTLGISCGIGVGIVKLGADGRPVNSFGSGGVAMAELYAGVRWNLSIDGMMRLYAEGAPRTACPAAAGSGVVYRFSG